MSPQQRLSQKKIPNFEIWGSLGELGLGLWGNSGWNQKVFGRAFFRPTALWRRKGRQGSRRGENRVSDHAQVTNRTRERARMAPPGMKYYYKEGVYETPPPSKPRSQFSIETMSWAIQGYYKQLYGSGWFAKPKQNWDAAEEVPDLKPNTGDWSSGLFDCCNSDHCIRGCCYPCCMFGDIVAALPRETGGKYQKRV